VHHGVALEMLVEFSSSLLEAVVWIATAQVLTGGQWGGQSKQNVVANINSAVGVDAGSSLTF